jgi:hypothetical protein
VIVSRIAQYIQARKEVRRGDDYEGLIVDYWEHLYFLEDLMRGRSVTVIDDQTMDTTLSCGSLDERLVKGW